MKGTLKLLFLGILAAMLWITIRASLQQPLWESFPDFEFVKHPWPVATLYDAYCGFITFYAWVFYKERSWVSRIGWFVLVMGLGNIAMSIYVLIQLFGLKDGEPAESILLRRQAA
jgi:hypothetical protein